MREIAPPGTASMPNPAGGGDASQDETLHDGGDILSVAGFLDRFAAERDARADDVWLPVSVSVART